MGYIDRIIHTVVREGGKELARMIENGEITKAIEGIFSKPYDYRIFIENKCKHSISIYCLYKKAKVSELTHEGWFNFSPGEEGCILLPKVDPNSHFIYLREEAGGHMFGGEVKGNTHVVKGKSLNFNSYNLNEYKGGLTLTFSRKLK